MSRYSGHRINSNIVGESGRKGRRIARKAPVAVVAVMSCCCLVVGGSAMTLGSQAPEDDSLLASVVAVTEGDNGSASLAVEKDLIVLQPEKEENEPEVVVEDIEEEEEPVPDEEEVFEPVSVIQEIPDEDPEPVNEEPVVEEPVQEDVIEEPEQAEPEEPEEPEEEESAEEPVEEVVEPVEEETEEPEPVEEEIAEAEPEPVEEEVPAEIEEPEEEVYETAVLGVAISSDEVENEDETAAPEATPSTEATSTTVAGLDYPVTGAVNATAGLNLRSGSSTSTSILVCIPYNTYLTLTGEENGWYKTSYMGYEGYVSGNYITITNGETASAESSSSSNSTTTATPSTNNNGSLNFIWPVYGGTISSNYGMRSGSMHYGTDIYSPLGTNIHASESGTVSYTGTMGTYGLLVIIDHANGYQTYYAHCSQILCSVGQYVNQGDVIALVGQTGNATGPHCHFEIRINGTAYNPLNWVSPS